MPEPKQQNHQQPDRLAQVEAENAQLRDRLANIEKFLALQAPVTTPIKQAQDRDEEFEKLKKVIVTPAKVQTQNIARRRYTDSTKEYAIKIVSLKTGKEEIPEILIPARSVEEAKGRYDALCGILGVDSERAKYVIGPPVAAPQQQAV